MNTVRPRALFAIASLLVSSACGDDGAGTGGGPGAASGTEATTAAGTGSPSATDASTSDASTTNVSTSDTTTSTTTATGEGAGGAGGAGAGGNGSGAGGEGGSGSGGAEAGSCGDGVRSGAETDVDCGGPCAGCAPGLACEGDQDCVSGSACDLTGDAGVCRARPIGVWSQGTHLGAPLPDGMGITDEVMFYDSVLERTVVYGGFWCCDFVFDFTALYDGSSWVDAEPGGDVPPPRALGAGAYMTARGRGVVFGGTSLTDTLVDTWEWVSADRAWEQAEDGTGVHPPWRREATLTYDVARDVVVLFGGGNGSGLVPGVWEWDGSSWTNPTPEGGIEPPLRYRHGAAYHAGLGMVVVHGGSDAGDVRLADTWGWDGTVWTKLAEPPDFGPGALTHVDAMAWDSDRDRIVLFGGNFHDVYASPATWEFDGAGWSLVETPLGTTQPTYASPMVYDAARARMVLLRATGDVNRTDEYWVVGNACDEADACGSGFCEDGACCASSCGAGDCNTVLSPGICQ